MTWMQVFTWVTLFYIPRKTITPGFFSVSNEHHASLLMFRAIEKLMGGILIYTNNISYYCLFKDKGFF